MTTNNLASRKVMTRNCGLAIGVLWLIQGSAQAGPFTDWLFGGLRRQPPAYPVGPAYAVGAPVGNYYGAAMPIVGAGGYGYLPQNPGGVAAAALPQPTVAYLPDYRSTYYRAPVTYYRPILSTDPATGSQVVALAPCTSYEYQAQRVPTWGSQAYYGMYGAPPVTVPVAPRQPTYTLPSGGIPIVGANPPSGYGMSYPKYSTGNPNYPSSMPNYSSGYGGVPLGLPPYSTGYGTYRGDSYGTGYGAYGAFQPGGVADPGAVLTAPPAGSYPTSPYGSAGGYYGTNSGGSTGTYSPSFPVPGLTAPLPSNVMPPANSGAILPQSILPQTSSPSNGLLPQGPFQQTVPGTNPADPNVKPSLSPSSSMGPPYPGSSARLDQRNQFQNVVRQPSLDSDRAAEDETRRGPGPSAPTMMPIPVPDNFKHEPRWNPGLLKESDQTAQAIPSEPSVPQEHLWGSKPIQWASFTQLAKPSVEADAQPELRLRPITESAQSPNSAKPTSGRYRTDGWQPAK